MIELHDDDFVTSDHHLGHHNIIKYCPLSRGHFSSVQEMNQDLTDNWNSVISPDSLVYYLGDFSLWGNEEGLARYLSKLNGTKILIVGNHDRCKKTKVGWKAIYNKLHAVYKGQEILMSHHKVPGVKIPNLHGHSHSYIPTWNGNYYDVGVDANNLTPLTIREVFSKRR